LRKRVFRLTPTVLQWDVRRWRGRRGREAHVLSSAVPFRLAASLRLLAHLLNPPLLVLPPECCTALNRRLRPGLTATPQPSIRPERLSSSPQACGAARSLNSQPQ
jgi:hypothetical protein